MKTKITKDDVGKLAVILRDGSVLCYEIGRVGKKTITPKDRAWTVQISQILFIGTEKEIRKFRNEVESLHKQKRKIADTWFSEKIQELKGEGYE